MGVNPGKATNDPNSYFAIGKQTAKATEAVTFVFAKQLDGSAFEVEKEIQREREGGDGQEVGLTYVSLVRGDGGLNINDRAVFAARVFAYVLGGDSEATGVGNASLRKHTAFPQASLPYVTIDQRWNDEIERVVDGAFTGFTLEGEAGRPWKVTGNYISGGTIYQRDVASALTVVREGGKPFFYPGGSYVIDAGASYANDLTKVRIEVTRGVDDAVQTTALTRDDVIPLNFDATVDATVKYTSREFYKKVKYNGGSQLLQDLPTGSIDLTMVQQVPITGSVNGTGIQRIRMPLIEWTEARVNKMDPDGKTVYLDVVGMTVKGSTHAIWIETDNNEAGAYIT